ncbi:MAG: response regulator [Holophagales bacterium]|jgi:putative two-component system response regulator|nr:response regulator [Holophagales bacterium]
MAKERSKIILVDDDKATLDHGRNLLKTFYEVFPAVSAAKLFEILESVIPDLILLDIDMPETSGYEAIKMLKSNSSFADIPVILLASKSDAGNEMEGLNLGAVDYAPKPFSGPLLLKRIEKELLIVKQKKDIRDNQELLMSYTNNLAKTVMEKTNEVSELQSAVLSTITNLVEFRDKLTGGHIMRTKLYIQALFGEMKRTGIYANEISEWNEHALLSSVQLHDVGKIAIPDHILNKAGKLTEEEYEIMKTHVTVGVDAIEKIMSKTREHSFLRHAMHIAGTHHERWDGNGYPIGLSEKNIPLEGRMMAIADVYDALVMVRPYRNALSHEEACKIIREGSGKQFEPILVDVFFKVEEKFAQIASNQDEFDE